MLKIIFSKLLKQYYLLFILIYVVFFNLFLRNLVVSGLLYYVYLLLLNIVTLIIILKHNDTLKLKNVLYPLFIINILFAKNLFYVIFLVILIILLTILNFMKSNTIKISLLILGILILINIPMIYFLVMLSFYNNDNIYEDTHYYCNDYEIYIHSAGAMDSFHYNVIRKHNILILDNVIEIVYNEEVGDTLEDYENILNNHQCHLNDD